MAAWEYVYIFEDGTVQCHNEPPSETDLYCIGDGTLQVLQGKHITCFDADNTVEPLQPCDRSTPDDAGDWYHEPS